MTITNASDVPKNPFEIKESNDILDATSSPSTDHPNNDQLCLIPFPTPVVTGSALVIGSVPSIPEVPNWDVFPIRGHSTVACSSELTKQGSRLVRIGRVIGDLLPQLYRMIIWCLVSYFTVAFYLAFTRDVDWEVYKKSMSNSVDVALCTVNYNTNKCGTHFIPDLMERCAAWKACKDTNPESVSRTRITAQLLSDISAQLVEGFLGQLSLPTLTFLILVVCISCICARCRSSI